MTTDTLKFHEHLRASTIQLLGYADADQLTAAQEIRVDRAVMLRLLIDDLQARQMRGEPIDVHAFVSASEDLERMVGGNPAASPPTRFGVDHKARLKALIERTVLAAEVPDPADVEREAELMRREEMAAVIAAGGAIEPALAPSAPAIVAPPPPERPPNVVPLHYLKEGQAREPWRDYYDGRVTGPSSWPLPR